MLLFFGPPPNSLKLRAPDSLQEPGKQLGAGAVVALPGTFDRWTGRRAVGLGAFAVHPEARRGGDVSGYRLRERGHGKMGEDRFKFAAFPEKFCLCSGYSCMVLLHGTPKKGPPLFCEASVRPPPKKKHRRTEIKAERPKSLKTPLKIKAERPKVSRHP